MNNLKIIKGLLTPPVTLTGNDFVELYNALLFREGRIYSEREISKLPGISNTHPYYKEWIIRKHSCNKLRRYIKQHSQIFDILEVGCGNGWLSAQLSLVTKGLVTGIDINPSELEQARKVFNKRFNLQFIEGEISSGILADQKYDLIVFAASVQYFNSLKEIIKIATRHLTLQGEIHIIDSHLYRSYEIPMARLNSKKYFADIRLPAMADLYFHHNINELQDFTYSVLYNPGSGMNKILFRKNNFHWVTIKNSYL